jgi:DNA gyrase/topoisomerase IV subunit B
MHDSALLICALIAYSVHEHQEGFVNEISISLSAEGFTIDDDGRGIGLHRAGYVESLMGTLVGGPGAVQLHGVGLSLVAASLATLTVQSRRNGELWTQRFVRGIAEVPPSHESAQYAKTGTHMAGRFLPGQRQVDLAALEPQFCVWRSRYPELLIRIR